MPISDVLLVGKQGKQVVKKLGGIKMLHLAEPEA